MSLNGKLFDLLLFVFLSLCSGCSIDYHVQQASSPALEEDLQNFEGMRVHFLGIERGESTLIQFPDDYTVLIDTGHVREKNAEQDQHETEDRSLVNILTEQGVKKIDLLILTNGMSDHIGGLNDVLEQYSIKKIIVPGILRDSIINSSTFEGIEIVNAEEGYEMNWPLGVKMKVLFPGNFLSLSPQANSLVFFVQHQDLRFLFTSDINDRVELKLLQKYDLHSQILKVSDGGRAHASHPAFLEEVDAQVAVIFDGDGEGHGREEVMERLYESWIDVYRTSVHGTITVFSTGDDYQVVEEKN